MKESDNVRVDQEEIIAIITLSFGIGDTLIIVLILRIEIQLEKLLDLTIRIFKIAIEAKSFDLSST